MSERVVNHQLIADPLSGERLDAIRARLDAAPSAPWIAAPDCIGPTIRIYAGDHKCAVAVGLMCDEGRRDSIAALTANAPADLRDLLAEVQRLQAEVDRLRGPRRHCYHCLEDLPQGATDDCCDGCRDQLRRDEEAE